MGLFDDANRNTLSNNVTSPAHAAVARQLSAASHVLLKNDGALLPLDTGRPLKIAMFGLAAREPVIGGGGSGSVFPAYIVSPYQGRHVV